MTTLDMQETVRYRAISLHNVHEIPAWESLAPEVREAVQVVGQVLPFRTNPYVVERLIDWVQVPRDPIFRLTFPRRHMLHHQDYERIRALLHGGADRRTRQAVANAIRFRLNPHPAGQLTHNVPELDGRKLPGLQHKYPETVLFFPARGQTCHAYCSYCFRWAQFVGVPELKFQAQESRALVDYLRAHPEVSDVLVTGGDPLIMKTRLLRDYLEPLLGLDVDTIRIGTKSLAYWPLRFLTDEDADDCLRFFEEIIAAGKHLALMAHFCHPRELETPEVQKAIRRIRATGAEIRTQAPLIRGINDDPAVWARMWRLQVRLGLVPYYMFIARDTGPQDTFEVPLARAHEIFSAAFSQVSGLARTVRGPSMSAFPGKVRVLGTARVAGEKVFVLDFLQGRDPSWVGRPFFARFDPQAAWLSELEPAFGARRFFFEEN